MNQLRKFVIGVLVIGGVVLVCGTFFLVYKEKKRSYAIQDEINALEQQKAQYEKENNQLRDRIAYLKTDQAYEKEAKKLNYKNAGEHVVIVRRLDREGDNVNKKNIEETKNEEKNTAHYRTWFRYFFK